MIRKIINELVSVGHQIDETNGRKKDKRIYAAASPGDIARREKQLGKKLPKSYKEFLKVTNGMSKVGGGMGILGVPGKGLNSTRRFFKSREFKTSYIPLAASPDGHFAFFDTSKKSGTQEYAVVLMDRDLGQVQGQYKNFTKFLEHCLSISKRILKEDSLDGKGQKSNFKPIQLKATKGKTVYFWKIEVEGNKVNTFFNRYGSVAKMKTMRCNSKDAASAKAHQLLKTKLKEGYKKF